MIWAFNSTGDSGTRALRWLYSWKISAGCRHYLHAIHRNQAWSSSSLCSGNGVHLCSVNSSSHAVQPETAPGHWGCWCKSLQFSVATQLNLTRYKESSWVVGWGLNRARPTVIGNRPLVPQGLRIMYTAGKGKGRVKTLREARWDHLTPCISHE